MIGMEPMSITGASYLKYLNENFAVSLQLLLRHKADQEGTGEILLENSFRR